MSEVTLRDRLLLRVACWCRSRMSPRTKYIFDRSIRDHFNGFWGDERGER